MLKAGQFYSKDKTLSEEELVALAIEKLGLSQFDLFDPKKKIIEYQL
jgi:hypothetical protein